MKILVADDDSFFRNFYSTKLREYGHTVEVAADGDETIEKLRSFMPNILMLDIIMPKKDGFSVLVDLKKDPILSSIPILIFSTLGQESDVQKALKLGATDYINKSFFDFPKMLEKINLIIKQ